MYIASGLLIVSFGFTMLKIISCYSNGRLLENQCQSQINVNHNQNKPQSSEPPFQVDWTPEWNGDSNVTLRDKSGRFIGFMLDFRNCDGSFVGPNMDDSRLICGDRVVVQPNNIEKTSIRRLWTSTSSRSCVFRVSFVKNFSTFWETDLSSTTPSSTPPSTVTQTTGTPTAPLTPEASSIQTSPTTSPGTPTAPLTPEASSIQTSPTTSPDVVRPASSSPQCVKYLRSILALLLFSRLCFLGGSSLLIIIRPDLKKMATMSVSVLELASKTFAVILVLIKTIKYECVYKCAGLQTVFTALTVAAMVSSLLHTITVFLHCGPSHELRKCWISAIIVIGLTNTINTTIAIFFGTWCFEEPWLPILMGVYVVWEIILYLGSVCVEKMEKYQARKKVGSQNHILEKGISPWLFMFIIFTVFNVMLTVALMTGVSLVKMIN